MTNTFGRPLYNRRDAVECMEDSSCAFLTDGFSILQRTPHNDMHGHTVATNDEFMPPIAQNE